MKQEEGRTKEKLVKRSFTVLATLAILGGCQPNDPTPPAPTPPAPPIEPAPPTPPPAPVEPTPPTQPATGKDLYEKNTCRSCHDSGIAGAPKLGDKVAWAERNKKGAEALTNSVVKGMGAMPPNGATTLSDAEIRSVVEYMMNEGR